MDINEVKAQHEAANDSEVVVKYGTGNVAFQEMLGGYMVRYEAETVPQLVELMNVMEARSKQRRQDRESVGKTGPKLTKEAMAYLTDTVSGSSI